MTKLKKTLVVGLVVLIAFAQSMFANGTIEESGTVKSYSYSLISKVTEGNTRVVALAIDFEKTLDIAWELGNAFKVSAELLPVESYTGDLIANSGVPKSERKILKAYTSDVPEVSSPKAGKYVIIEMEPFDISASSYYIGFNPGIRQLIPYGDKMKYDVDLLYDLNYFAPNISPAKPGSEIETISKYSTFKLSGHKVMTADDFTIGSFSLDSNKTIKAIGYNFYAPAGLEKGEKVPLVVFLHGSGQSHDYKNLANDLLADVRSPLLVSEGGVTWIENMPEKCYVLVPQMPARDTKDETGEYGWNNIETQSLAMGLVNKMIAENPAIDTDRLYLTGLSMGGFGSWGIVSSNNKAVSNKFAAAVIIAGANGFNDVYRGPATIKEFYEKQLATKSFKASNVNLPVWICAADADPVVNIANSRSPFAILSDSSIDASGAVVPGKGVRYSATSLQKDYVGTNVYTGKEVRYSEYLYGDGAVFRDLGMVTRNGHFSWEVTYKDQEVLDWMFAQHK